MSADTAHAHDDQSVRIGDLLLDTPVICAPMAGGPTTPALVSGVSAAGGLGMLAPGYLTAAELAGKLDDVDSATGGRYGVNLFLPGPDETADPSAPANAAIEGYRQRLAGYAGRYGVEVGAPCWFDEDIDATVTLLGRYRPGLITTTFGDPGAELVDRIHDEVGAAVGVTVTSVAQARSAVRSGADLLIAQGIEAGGHRGIWVDDSADPLGGPAPGTVDLVTALVAAVEIPVIAAGGLMTGADIDAVLAAGAVAAQLGTAFLRADEAGTSAVHRDALARGRENAEDSGPGSDAPGRAEPDTVITRAFSGRPARSLRNAFAVDNADAPAAYPQVHYMTKPIRAGAAAAGVADDVNLWAGTGWRAAAAAPAATIVERLRTELRAARDHR